jgi:hypothetical protein
MLPNDGVDYSTHVNPNLSAHHRTNCIGVQSSWKPVASGSWSQRRVRWACLGGHKVAPTHPRGWSEALSCRQTNLSYLPARQLVASLACRLASTSSYSPRSPDCSPPEASE